MARARGRPAQAAARPRPPGSLPARLHDQAAVRRRRPARRRPHPRRHLFLHRCGEHLRPPLPLLEEGRPRPRRARGCDRGLVRLLLLPPRPRRRHRPAGVVGADVRPRVGDRDRAGRRKYRPRARRCLEPQGARPPVVRRRDHLRGDRALPDPGDADPARRRVLRARQRRAAGPTPPGRRARRAATSDRPPRRRARHRARRDGAGGGGQPRHRAPPCRPGRAHRGEDRDLPGDAQAGGRLLAAVAVGRAPPCALRRLRPGRRARARGRRGRGTRRRRRVRGGADRRAHPRTRLRSPHRGAGRHRVGGARQVARAAGREPRAFPGSVRRGRAAGRTGAGDPRRAGRGSEPDRSRAQPYAPMRKLDPWLLLAALAISVGSYLAQSSTAKALATPGFANRQIVWLAVGGVLILLFAFTDYRVLAAMFVIAPVRAGTHRWLLFGSFTVQPSDFARIATILAVAALAGEHRNDLLDLRTVARLAAMVGVPALLVLLQPDLGTAVTFGPILLAALWLGGLPWRAWVGLALAGLVVVACAWFWVLRPYQQERILTFVDPDRAPYSSGYQQRQSKIAVGSGEVTGKGLQSGTQSQLRFLPAQYTDFIFAVWAEETGFVGSALLLAAYALMVYRVFVIALSARDRVGAIFAGCAAAVLGTQILVNVGMVTGLAPTTGITLPLLSYGGSSVVATCIVLGILQS